MMNNDNDRLDEPEEMIFPLTSRHINQIKGIASMFRENLEYMEPQEIQASARAILALENLPRATPGVSVTFTFLTEKNNGNYEWADISIDEQEFALGQGAHLYDPEVGGDTESSTQFFAVSGTEHCRGDIGEWFAHAAQIADMYHEYRCEDNSNDMDIVWYTD